MAIFVTIQSQPSGQKTLPLKRQGALVRIIDKLAGPQANLEVELEQLTFNLGKSKHTVSGKIVFNVVHLEEPGKEAEEAEDK